MPAGPDRSAPGAVASANLVRSTDFSAPRRASIGPAAKLAGPTAASPCGPAPEGMVIGVNRRHAKTRQRFTAAHELGHALLHRGAAVHHPVENVWEFLRQNYLANSV